MTEFEKVGLFLDWISSFIEATGYVPTQAEIKEYRKMYDEMIEN